MITLCPKCALTLAVTAADLRVGQGQVRCGRCAAVFNALAGLSEELAEAADPRRHEFDPTSTDVAEHLARNQLAPPPPELAPELPADAPAEPEIVSSAVEAPLADDAKSVSLPSVSLPSGSLHEPANDVTAADVPSDDLPGQDALPPAANDASADTPQSANDDLIDPVAANDLFEVDVDVESIVVQPGRAEMSGSALAAVEEPEQPAHLDLDLTPLQASRPRNYWTLGSVALTLLLGIQAIHHNRNALAARDNLRGPLQSLYRLFGAQLQPQWSPAAFEVRRRGEMIADSDGAMTLRATVQNTAANSQPLPLLRVVLLDRFGARISARDLLPGEYLPENVASNLSYLAAGQRVDAEVALADPGPAATGFELDACLRLASNQLQCASNAAVRP